MTNLACLKNYSPLLYRFSENASTLYAVCLSVLLTVDVLSSSERVRI